MSFPPTNSRPDMRDPRDMIHALMAQLMGGSTASSEGCMETEWRGLPAAPIFNAAYKGNVAELVRLLEDPEMRSRVNDLDGDKSGILHGVAFSSVVLGVAADVVNAVVDAGGDVNLKNGTEETPLQMAVLYEQVELAKALLDRGARVDLADWKGDGPVPTAQKLCKHSGKAGERCCQVLHLVVEAEKTRKEDKSIQQQADRLRDRGNKAFQKGQYEKARDLYTQSLEVMEDYRAFSNRALCNLEIGKSIIAKEWPSGRYPFSVARWGEEAMVDAGKTIRMNPTFEKGYYRMALGHAMARDFPRTKMDVVEGLKECPNSDALKILLDELNDLGVPNHIGNPFSDRSEEANRKVKNGDPSYPCIYCRELVPLPLVGNCPFCTMPLETDLDEQVLIDFILNH